MQKFYRMVFAPLLLISGLARASEAAPSDVTWALTGSSNLTFVTTSYSDQGTSNRFTAEVGAGWFLTQTWELGGEALFENSSSSDSSAETITRLTVGPSIDFGGSPADAFVLAAHLGFQIYTSPKSSNTYTTFAYLVGLSKRFALANHVSWAPEVTMIGHTSASQGRFDYPAALSFAFVPFRITVLF